MKIQTTAGGNLVNFDKLKRLTIATVVAVGFCHVVTAATTMTGLVETSTDASGNWNGDSRWSTHGNQTLVDIFVIGGSNLNGPFLNGPSDAQAAISIPLSPGTHTFTMFAGGGVLNPSHGLNIFFNGDSLTPGISVFGPTQTSPTPPFPLFGPNGGTNTQALNLQDVPPANSTIYVDGLTRVTLTDYRWAAPSVYNLDRVSQPFVGYSSVGPDGRPDWVGQFTIDVTAVPVDSPSTLIIPPAFATVDGNNGSGVLREVIRLQEAYGASFFPSHPITIREIHFRPSTVAGYSFTSSIPDLQINLSTTTRAPEGLSATFTENTGADDTVVFHGPVELSSAFSGPASGPKVFDIVIRLTAPFVYDPSEGNLLVDFRNFSGSTVSWVDVAGVAGDQASRAISHNINGTQATTLDTGADILRIVYTGGASTPPSIVSEPQSQTVVAGSTVTFQVEAAGTPPLSYQWRLNTGPLSGQTNSTLVLSNVQPSQAGGYSVRVANAAGFVISSNAVLAVQPPPVVVISGLGVMGTDLSGNWSNDTRWNTIGSDSIVSFYVAGANLTDPFLNGPSDAQAAVSIPLSFGTHTFSFFLPGGDANDRHGLNIFFNGNNLNPGISAFAPTQVSATSPPFVVNGALNSQSLAGQTVPAANSLTFRDDNSIITLTQFYVAAGSVHSLDRVGFVPFGQSFVGSDGLLDRVGQFTVTVAPLPTNPPPAVVISGLGVMGTDASGNWSGDTRWNTIGNDNIVSFYVAGANLTSPFLNGPADAQAAVSIPLSFGTHTFSFFLPGGNANDRHGLNIFFNGNNLNPGISAFAPTQVSATSPPFVVNGALNSQSLAGQTVPAANSLTFRDDNSIITLTQFYVAAGSVHSLDRVGFVPFGQSFVGSDGLLDRVGQFTVTVAPLPTNPPPSCVPAPAGVVAWWPADGNPNDVVGTNHGTLLNGVSYGPGKVSQGFAFSTPNNAVRVAASPSVNVGAAAGFTIEGWINPADLSHLRPIAEWNNGVGTIGVHLWTGVDVVTTGDGERNLYANLIDTSGTSHQIRSAKGLVTAGAWQHVALSYNKSSGLAVIYHNGAVVAQANLGSFTPQTSGNLYFGFRPSGPFSGIAWAGGQDEMGLYNRALSGTEIQAIAHAGAAGKCKPPGPPVNVPPAILAISPLTQSVPAGSLAFIRVTATGTPPLSFQWMRNGVPISSGGGSTLVLSNVTPSLAGLYSVRVTNPFGAATSPEATLIVTGSPVNHPPVADARIAPLALLIPDNTNRLVISPNGSNAVVFLDGSLSSDPDNDPLEFFWFADGGAVPFASGVRVTNIFDIGEHTVVLLADDGQATGADQVTFTVITLGEAVEELSLLIQESDLSAKTKRPLLATLQASIASFDRGNAEAGVSQLRAFCNKVRAQVGGHDPALAAKLIHACEVIHGALKP